MDRRLIQVISLIRYSVAIEQFGGDNADILAFHTPRDRIVAKLPGSNPRSAA